MPELVDGMVLGTIEKYVRVGSTPIICMLSRRLIGKSWIFGIQ
jgi:hypothetical protein